MPQRGPGHFVIRQVLNALVKNAVEASPSGQRVQLSCECTSGVLRFLVKDSGSGMSSDQLARVAEPFYTTKESGMGLGLSICKSVVEAHNGIISADSGPEGTRFIVELPCSPAEEGPTNE